MDQKFYITTTLPYVNAAPHIGFALELVQADVIARWQRMQGKEVFFNTGTDEHGLKIHRKAEELGMDTQTYVDQSAATFDVLKSALNVSYNAFIRTTDPHHKTAAQEFWKRCDAAGDIYKKIYKVKYCVGCELEKTDSELADGKCPLHPNLEIELIEEENYFFRFSKYQQPLLELYEKNPQFVVPSWRLNEIRKFVENGLEDFSISRLKEKMPWGVPVPGDDAHVMYVWFDALINYISTLGWPENEQQFTDFWPGVQVAGKDNLRQQSAMWQAMLLSAGLPTSRQVLIHGFITSGGQKMSKSLGNVVDPLEVVKKYGTDAVRYYLLAEIPPFEDGDFTVEKLETRYQADLGNKLGNLIMRVTTLLETHNGGAVAAVTLPEDWRIDEKQIETLYRDYKTDQVLRSIFEKIEFLNKQLDDAKPWAGVKEEATKPAAIEVLSKAVIALREIADYLEPFLPATAENIRTQLQEPLKKGEPLFPRLAT